MFETVHHQAVVDFVGEDHELMLTGEFNDLLQHFRRVQRASRIVRVDDDNRFRTVGDLAPHILDIGIPFRLLVTHVMHGRTTRQRDARRPQRIIRRRHQHLITVVKQRRHAQIDQFAHTVARVNPVDADIRDILELRVLHDRLASGEQAFRIGIAFAIGQLLRHVVYDFIRRAEAERRRIADIELEDMGPGGFHSRRFVDNRSSDIIEHVIKLR